MKEAVLRSLNVKKKGFNFEGREKSIKSKFNHLQKTSVHISENTGRRQMPSLQ